MTKLRIVAKQVRDRQKVVGGRHFRMILELDLDRKQGFSWSYLPQSSLLLARPKNRYPFELTRLCWFRNMLNGD